MDFTKNNPSIKPPEVTENGWAFESVAITEANFGYLEPELAV